MILDSLLQEKYRHNQFINICFPDLTLGVHICIYLNGTNTRFDGSQKLLTFTIVEIGSHFAYRNDPNLKNAVFEDPAGNQYLAYCRLDDKFARLTWRETHRKI